MTGMNPLQRDSFIRRKEVTTAEDTKLRTRHVVDQQTISTTDLKANLKEMHVKRAKFGVKAVDLMKKEHKRALDADQKGLTWSTNFKRNACEALLYALLRMQAAIEKHEKLHKTRKCFKYLRFIYIDGKAMHMYNYFRLRRYLQICARYRYLLRALPVYANLRRKYVSVRRWLAYIQLLYETRSKGMSRVYRRRRTLYLSYSRLLTQMNLIPIHHHYSYLNPLLTTRKSLFHRWVNYVQRRVVFRNLSRLARALRSWRLLRRVISVWHTGMSVTQSFRLRTFDPVPFGEKRVMADLGIIRGWIVAVERKSTARRITQANRRWKRTLKKSVMAVPSFKKAMGDYEEEVRLMTKPRSLGVPYWTLLAVGESDTLGEVAAVRRL